MQSLSSMSLTPMQLGMLYQWRLSRHAGVNLEQMLCRLPETIDPQKLKQAWALAAKRYGVLRTGFVILNPAFPQQTIYDHVKIPFYEVDWRHKNEQERAQALELLLADDRKKGFDLTHAPLMRVHLIRNGEQDWHMLWSFHHIILDGRSFPLVLRQLFADYETLVAGETPTVQPAPPFGAFEAAVRRQSFEKAEPYWRNLLADLAEQQLPQPYRSLPMVEQIEHRQLELVEVLAEDRVTRLAGFAKDVGVTFNTLVQAVWGWVLSAYTGSDDVVFGTVRACRYLDVPNIKETAGMMINTLPFRVKIDTQQKVRDWLHDLRRQQVDARPFEAVPIHEIQNWCGLDSDTPMVRTMCMFENQVLQKVLQNQGGAWTKRGFKLYEKTEFPLALSAYQDRDLKLILEYNEGVYERKTAAEIMALAVHVLEQLPEFCDRPVVDLPTLTPAAEKIIMAYEAVDFPKDMTLYQLFERQVALRPDAEAMRTGDTRFTYAELNRWSNQIAHLLIGQGVKPGAFVGVSLERSPIMIAGVLGILKTGAAYVPLDPNYPQERLQWMIEDTAPHLVLTQKAHRDGLAIEDRGVICVDEDPNWLAGCPDTNPDLDVSMDQWGMAIFTSGSTGRPKGVVLPYHALVNHIHAAIHGFDITPNDCIPQVSTINFDVSVEEIFCALASGATLILPRAETLNSLSEFLRWVEAEQVTFLDLTTLFWTELVHYMADHNLMFPDCVRIFICGGERSTWSAFNDWLKVGGERITWANAYGPTETCSMATFHKIDPSKGVAPMSVDPPIGKPLANDWCYVLDPLGRLAPLGVVGELFIGGAGVSDGYLHREDLTAERFVPDRFRDPERRMYRTGDRCFLNHDGDLVYVDRIDNQVKLRGFRIELGEVESALMRCPEVQDGVVVVRKAPSGHQQLVAYAIAKEGADPTPNSVLAFMRDELPAFMTPSAVAILPVFPKSPSGKVDRKNLPDPDWGGQESAAGREPQTELEKQLQAVWEDVLGVSPISLDDDFFALGGDSLRAMTMSSQIEGELGRAVPLALLLRQRTLGEYAHALENQLELEAFAPLVKIREGAGIPLFLLHSLGGDILIYRELADSLAANVPIYGLQMQGLDQQSAPHETVAEAARDFVARIREVQAQGPYFVAGYSSGGILAMEIAQQLQDYGDEVAFVGIIDSAIPPKVEEANKPSPLVSAGRFLRNLPWFFLDGALYNPKVLASKVRRKLQIMRRNNNDANELQVKEIHEANQSPDIAFDLKDHFAVDISIFPEYRINLMEKHFMAFSQHDPRVYGGSVTVFRTRRQPLLAPHNRYLGWDFICKEKPKVVKLSGTHHQLLEQPHVAFLSQQLSTALEEQGALTRAGEIRTDAEMNTQNPN